MTHAEARARNALILADSERLTYSELATKYDLSVYSIGLILARERKRAGKVAHAESRARNQAILADAPNMSYPELAAKYRMTRPYLGAILSRAKVKIGKPLQKGPTGMTREAFVARNQAILTDALDMSYTELMAKHKLPLHALQHILSKAGVGIGRRANMRKGLTTDHENAFKQLKIVAAIRAKDGRNLSEIGRDFKVHREWVSQLAFMARQLGLIDA